MLQARPARAVPGKPTLRPSMKNKTALPFTFAFTVLLALFASAGAQTLRWAAQGDVQTLDPHSQNEILTNMVNGQIYETLVKRDRQLKVAPGLATEWKQVSPLLW
eukprot:gene46817-58386_t